MNKKVVLILGMHRSGTSVLSAGLQSMGVYLGDKLFSPESDNPKGNYENEKIVCFSSFTVTT